MLEARLNDTKQISLDKIGPNKILLKEIYEKCARAATLFIINIKFEEHEIEEIEYILKTAEEICASYQKQYPNDKNLQAWLRIIEKTKEALGFYKSKQPMGINAGQFARNIKAIYDLIKWALPQAVKQGA